MHLAATKPTTTIQPTTNTAIDCGNGLIDPDEECDGADLNGQSCEGLNLGTGTLTCIECAYNTTSCHQDPLKIYQSGARIKMRVGRAPSPDGSVSFNGWYDTKPGMQMNCVFRKMPDRVIRCIPELTADKDRFYEDSGCTTRLARFAVEDSQISTNTKISVETSTGVFEVFRVIGPPSTIRVKDEAGDCSNPSTVFLNINDLYSISPLSAEQFQEQFETRE